MSSKGIQFEEEATALELQHINVKLLLRNSEQLDLDAVVNVFHAWIQEQAREELLLDVADYRHVHHGPGVVLIGHEADYSLDNTDGQLGVRYSRKTPIAGDNQFRLALAVRSAVSAALRLREDSKLTQAVHFNSEIEIVINDRLLVPNNPETRESIELELRSFAGLLLHDTPYSLTFKQDPRKLLTAIIGIKRPVELSSLLANLQKAELEAKRP